MSCNTTSTDVFKSAQRIFAEHGNFRETGSVDSARKYASAIDTMLPFLPQRQQMGGVGGESLTWDLNTLLKLRDDAERWATAKARQSTGRSDFVRFCRYRR